MMLKYVATALTATMLAAVAAVGVTVVEPQSAEAADGVEVTACGGGKVDLTAEEKKMLDLHNKARVDRNISRLCVHPDLQKAARAHSKEMIDKDRFAHGNVGQRLHKFGYRWSTYGENILRDPGSRDSVESLFKLWMNSSGHKANILEKDFREIGIGASSGKYKGGRATMWTVDFGDR